MSKLDAGLEKPLTSEEVAALQGDAAPATLPSHFGPPRGPGPVRPPTPADPDPVDDRPIDVIAADRAAAEERLAGLVGQRMAVVGRIAELDGAIAEKVIEGVVGGSLNARRRLADARLEERELVDLIERAQGRVGVLGRAWRHAWNLGRAEELRAEVADLVSQAQKNDAALDRALHNVFDLLDGRYDLTQQARLVAEAVDHAFSEDPDVFRGILTIPTTGGQPTAAIPPPEIALDRARIPALKPDARLRRYHLGL